MVVRSDVDYMKRRWLVVGLAAGLGFAACGQNTTESVESGEALTFLDPAEIIVEAEAIPVNVGAESGVLEYFAALDWLSEPAVGLDAVVRDPFGGPVYLDEINENQIGRNDARGQWWIPAFLPYDDPLFDLANDTTETHPVINYNYECADGLSAYVSHYVHEHSEFDNAFTRDDFIGVVDRDPETNQFSMHTIDTPSTEALVGYFRPTGVGGGPFAGGEYAFTIGLNSAEIDVGWISYGFYQYFSFTDQAGTEVTVQITAPSFDFPDGWLELDDTAPSILDGEAEPLELLENERVQARLKCGRELANQLAPVIAALDTSS